MLLNFASQLPVERTKNIDKIIMATNGKPLPVGGEAHGLDPLFAIRAFMDFRVNAAH